MEVTYLILFTLLAAIVGFYIRYHYIDRYHIILDEIELEAKRAITETQIITALHRLKHANSICWHNSHYKKIEKIEQLITFRLNNIVYKVQKSMLYHSELNYTATVLSEYLRKDMLDSDVEVITKQKINKALEKLEIIMKGN